MSNKTKSISDLVTELQVENERLRPLEKLLNQACRNEFGFDVKTIHCMLEQQKMYEQRRAERQIQNSSMGVTEMKL